MAQDDYFVLSARLLAYLYSCLKDGEVADKEYLALIKERADVGETYWDRLLTNLYNDGYIKGLKLIRVAGLNEPIPKVTDLSITTRGIEFFESNEQIRKAVEYLRSLKERVPGIK